MTMKIRNNEDYRKALEACREYALIQTQDNEGILRQKSRSSSSWQVDLNDLNELIAALDEYK